MQENKKQTLLERLAYSGLVGLTGDNNIHYVFDPESNSFLKLTWQSPNDKMYNVFDVRIDPNDRNFLMIKDDH